MFTFSTASGVVLLTANKEIWSNPVCVMMFNGNKPNPEVILLSVASYISVCLFHLVFLPHFLSFMLHKYGTKQHVRMLGLVGEE